MKYLIIYDNEELNVPFNMEVVEVKPWESIEDVINDDEKFYAIATAVPFYTFKRKFEKLVKEVKP